MTQFSIKPALKGVENANFSLKERLGSGGGATVYRERIGQQDYAIKIYTDASSFEAKKIEFMIANPPPDSVREVAGIKYPRYAWPLAVIRESGPSASPVVGYAMSVIDANKSKTLDYFFDHNLSKSLQNANSKALSFKVEILRNLSELIEELHESGHIFVDLKPQNVRVFEGANIVTFLDCDGFTIGEAGGAKRFQSTMVSPDYVAPEILLRANRNGPIGVEQDEYALAVMIFQMLNNGIHPFQGVIKDSNTNAPTNDDKAASALYPHGITPNPHITHRPQSVHDTWLDETRFLLDRAFVAGNKRPTATEWKQHFDKVLTQKLLVRCNARPNDAMHIRFRDKDCPACRRLQYRKAQPPLVPRAPAPPNVNPAPPPKSFRRDWEIIIIIVLIIAAALFWFIGLANDAATPTQEPATAEAAPAVEPQPTAPAEWAKAEDAVVEPEARAPTPSPLTEVTYSNGDKFVGEFKDDKRHGQGTYTFANGGKYVGEWKDGKSEGQGTGTYADGSKYVGEFKDGKPEGQGTGTYADGSKYVGEWKDGKPEGQGTYTNADGSNYVGG